MIREWQGRWALVTGASAGIGAALATELAAGVTNLVLTARRRERLAALGRELREKHAVEAESVVADLAEPRGPEEIFRFTRSKGLTIDLLVNNAGFGQYGELHTVEANRL